MNQIDINCDIGEGFGIYRICFTETDHVTAAQMYQELCAQAKAAVPLGRISFGQKTQNNCYEVTIQYKD